MNNVKALEACLVASIKETLLGQEREASRTLMKYIEGRLAENDMAGIDALMVCCRDDTILMLTNRHKAAILRTAFRVRSKLKEYDTCLVLWRKEPGMEKLLVGL